ncbi:hypothetical protein [Sporosarcina highlanderae]|uniref:Spore coat protein n=1 Tax=Sporosarcina highlanderae TaxID=3035916 RepID=A0ABT8JTF1_9BACL|nr:hypothetical protein [Sporosarcina highlanderae]MDN4608454.1 hypothetical protein [Sporosarcina highlanderae]
MANSKTLREFHDQAPSFYDQLINGVGPDFTIPIQTVPGQNQGGQERPALFGQNQQKHGFGPVYAIPTFPWQQGGIQGQNQAQGQGNDNSQQEHGQNQLNDDFGPVYAIPTYPWQQGSNQGQAQGSGQWQNGFVPTMGSPQWYPVYMYPNSVMPRCKCFPAGYR